MGGSADLVTATITSADIRRYIRNPHNFRREQIILPDGRTFGEAEEPWQADHVFAPV